MKTTIWRIGLMSGLLVLARPVCAGWVEFSVGEAIPDNDIMGVQDTVNLSGYEGPIVSVEARVTLTEAVGALAWNGDYYVTLQHSSGFSVLLNRAGRTASDPLGYSDTGFAITFAATGPDVHRYADENPVFDAEGRLTGTWSADGRATDPETALDSDPRTARLTVFSGLDANGEWTMFVADMNQNGNAVWTDWGLNIVTAIPEPTTVGLLLLGGVAVCCRRRRVIDKC